MTRKWIGPLASGLIGSVAASVVSPGPQSWQWLVIILAGLAIHVSGFLTGWAESSDD